MSSEDEQVQQRRANLAGLGKLGIEIYPRTFERRHTISALVDTYGHRSRDELEADRIETKTGGRILAIRAFGKANFLVLSDGHAKIQVYIRQDSMPELDFKIYGLLDLGDWVGVEGRLFRTKTNEFTIWASRLHFLSKCLLPLPEKWHGLTDVEIRYRQRYTDLIVNDEVRAVFRARAAIIRSLRSSLESRGFLEVETPVLQPLYGGASARPFVTHHHALDMKLYLRIADELYLKRLIVGGLERVYEISKDFRNEGIDRTHNPEFTMLEFYQAFADYEVVLESTQAILLECVKAVHGGLTVPFDGTPIDFTPPWRRLTIREAAQQGLGVSELPSDERSLRDLARRADVDLDPALGYGRILDEIVSVKVQPGLRNPTFLVDHPREISPLAKVKRGDPDVVERFELIVAGMEIANAFSEQNDPLEQRRAFEEQAKLRERGDEEAQMLDTDYLRALEMGMPPTGGVGIGVDRLVMLLTDSRSLRDVILFPHMRPEDGDGE